jgi:hypothetical protein
MNTIVLYEKLCLVQQELNKKNIIINTQRDIIAHLSIRNMKDQATENKKLNTKAVQTEKLQYVGCSTQTEPNEPKSHETTDMEQLIIRLNKITDAGLFQGHRYVFPCY